VHTCLKLYIGLLVNIKHSDWCCAFRPQVVPLLGRFTELPGLLQSIGAPKQIDAILFDVGVSSMQFDCVERGFSLSRSGPLDMRMDADRYVTMYIMHDCMHTNCLLCDWNLSFIHQHHLRFSIHFSAPAISIRTQAHIFHVEHGLDGSPHSCESNSIGAKFYVGCPSWQPVLGGEPSHWRKHQLARHWEQTTAYSTAQWPLILQLVSSIWRPSSNLSVATWRAGCPYITKSKWDGAWLLLVKFTGFCG